jgi:uncharacterized protein (TIGR00255 family)
MTGFGRGSASSQGKKITVEIKSLNSKQFDLMMRIPPYFREMEVDLRGRLAGRMERGKVELNAVAENIGDEAPVTINESVIRNYRLQIAEMSKKLGIPEPLDWNALLLRMPDALHAETNSLTEEDEKALNDACNLAVDALEEFRIAEGKKLYDFFEKKIVNIRALLNDVTPYEEERVPKIKAALQDRLAHLNGVEYDTGRLEQELIFYIEKLDVTEEKTRLAAHLNYFMETMGKREGDRSKQGQGKKLGFIAQEMGREINTLGSKSNHAEMQKIVVKMKDELEQIKEQVLNVL